MTKLHVNSAEIKQRQIELENFSGGWRKNRRKKSATLFVHDLLRKNVQTTSKQRWKTSYLKRIILGGEEPYCFTARPQSTFELQITIQRIFELQYSRLFLRSRGIGHGTFERVEKMNQSLRSKKTSLTMTIIWAALAGK